MKFNYDFTLERFLKNEDKVFEFFNSGFYSDYRNWFLKFRTELLNGTRSSILVFDNERLIAASLLKFDKEESKICSFKVEERYRKLGIGNNLMKYSLGSFLDSSKICITVPGNNKDTVDFCRFLTKFNFTLSGIKDIDSTKHELLFGPVLCNREKSIILSIKKYWSDEIRLGNKKVEFRRKEIPINTSYIFINETGIKTPIISGYFKVDSIISKNPEEIWKDYSTIGSINKEDFDIYFSGKDIGYAILIKEYYDLGIESKNLLGKDFKSPQFFKYLK